MSLWCPSRCPVRSLPESFHTTYWVSAVPLRHSKVGMGRLPMASLRRTPPGSASMESWAVTRIHPPSPRLPCELRELLASQNQAPSYKRPVLPSNASKVGCSCVAVACWQGSDRKRRAPTPRAVWTLPGEAGTSDPEAFVPTVSSSRSPLPLFPPKGASRASSAGPSRPSRASRAHLDAPQGSVAGSSEPRRKRRGRGPQTLRSRHHQRRRGRGPRQGHVQKPLRQSQQLHPHLRRQWLFRLPGSLRPFHLLQRLPQQPWRPWIGLSLLLTLLLRTHRPSSSCRFLVHRLQCLHHHQTHHPHQLGLRPGHRPWRRHRRHQQEGLPVQLVPTHHQCQSGNPTRPPQQVQWTPLMRCLQSW
mmetsp:Transcript_86334/g.180666  ORF Transcript_86334/g.180666 Transcript_86334/m.180666 type:complete len:359 (-) Transcript_86334:364-1440(-)